jgi:hypothetical protein
MHKFKILIQNLYNGNDILNQTKEEIQDLLISVKRFFWKFFDNFLFLQFCPTSDESLQKQFFSLTNLCQTVGRGAGGPNGGDFEILSARGGERTDERRTADSRKKLEG